MNFYSYLIAIFFVTFAGGLIPLRFAKTKSFIAMAVYFAAGVLIGTSLFSLLPESIEILGRMTGYSILAGFAIFYLPQKFMLTHPCEEEDCDFHSLGVMAFIGIAFHAFTDGIAIGSVSEIDDFKVVVGAVMAHKIPASLALSLMLIASGMGRGKIVLLMALFALATPFGAAITRLFLSDTGSNELIGHALGFSTGNFLAIAGSDVLRRLHQQQRSNLTVRLALLIIGCFLPLLGSH